MTDLSKTSEKRSDDKSSDHQAPKHSIDAQWIHICPVDALPIDSGMAALLNQDTADEEQIALFRIGSIGVVDGTADSETIYAVANFDPFSEANVLGRGILCSVNDELAVASPIGKEHFSLSTGQCIEEEDVSIKTYPSRILDGQVYVKTLSATQELT